MNKDDNFRDYLGDGVYADFDGFQIWLKANDYFNPTDKIALDLHTFNALKRYEERLRRILDAKEES